MRITITMPIRSVSVEFLCIRANWMKNKKSGSSDFMMKVENPATYAVYQLRLCNGAHASVHLFYNSCSDELEAKSDSKARVQNISCRGD